MTKTEDRGGLRVLVVGGGGREHAICWKLVQSPGVQKLWCAPGNGGIAGLAECVDLAAENVEGIVAFSRENQLDMVVVGPEVPLAMGLVDELEKSGIRAFGPNKACARLEATHAPFFARGTVITTWDFSFIQMYS